MRVAYLWAVCIGAAALLLPLGSANALSCSQANSECEAKLLANPIFSNPRVDAQSNSKVILNFICLNCSNIAPAATNGVIPTSPLTHFR